MIVSPRRRIAQVSLIVALALLPSMVRGQDQRLDRLERAPPPSNTADALAEIATKLKRRWHVNCSGRPVLVRVRIFLNPDGELARPPEPLDIDGVTDPAVKAAALRAVVAVSGAAPYERLPVADYDRWKTFVVRFDAEEACKTR